MWAGVGFQSVQVQTNPQTHTHTHIKKNLKKNNQWDECKRRFQGADLWQSNADRGNCTTSTEREQQPNEVSLTRPVWMYYVCVSVCNQMACSQSISPPCLFYNMCVLWGMTHAECVGILHREASNIWQTLRKDGTTTATRHEHAHIHTHAGRKKEERKMDAFTVTHTHAHTHIVIMLHL